MNLAERIISLLSTLTWWPNCASLYRSMMAFLICSSGPGIRAFLLICFTTFIGFCFSFDPLFPFGLFTPQFLNPPSGGAGGGQHRKNFSSAILTASPGSKWTYISYLISRIFLILSANSSIESALHQIIPSSPGAIK